MGSLPLPKSQQSWGTSGYPSPLGSSLQFCFQKLKKVGLSEKLGIPKLTVYHHLPH